jgi:hypothetical protein
MPLITSDDVAVKSFVLSEASLHQQYQHSNSKVTALDISTYSRLEQTTGNISVQIVLKQQNGVTQYVYYPLFFLKIYKKR